MPKSRPRSQQAPRLSLAKQGIGHIGLKVANLKESCKFYREILGLPAEIKNSRTAIILSGKDVIVLSQQGSEDQGFHFGFRLSSPRQVDRWRKKIESDNIPIYQDMRGKNHPRSFKIRDSDGYLVEISSAK